MPKLSKKLLQEQKRDSVFSYISFISNIFIAILIYLILDLIIINKYVKIIFSCLILSIIFIFDNYVLNLISKNCLLNKKFLIFTDSIFQNTQNISKEEKIINSFEKVFAIPLNENSIENKIEEIKIKINLPYCSYFIDAMLSKKQNDILKKMRNQISIFLQEKQNEEIKNSLIDIKFLLIISLFMDVLITMILPLININIFLINLAVIIKIIFYFTYYSYCFYFYKKNIKINFFQQFYLKCFYILPFDAFDKTCLEFPKIQEKMQNKKITILNHLDDFKIKNTFDKEISQILIKNELIKEENDSLKNNNYLLNYYRKNTSLIYFALPILLFIFLRFYA